MQAGSGHCEVPLVLWFLYAGILLTLSAAEVLEKSSRKQAGTPPPRHVHQSGFTSTQF